MRLPSLLAGLALAVISVSTHAASTLDTVKSRGTLRCGALNDMPGFGSPDSQGTLRGIDVDFCRAIAAATLGDANKVTFVATSPLNRFSVLQSGDVDVLIRQTTQTFTRDSQLGLLWAGITVYDGQGFMVRKDMGVTSVKELDGASICLLPGSNTEQNIATFYQANGMRYKPISIDNADALRRAFFEGRCDVYVGDRAQLAANRSVAPKPDDYVILPEVLAKSPLGPIVRQGDDQWLNIVKWTIYATLLAEENGVDSANVEAKRADSAKAEVARLLCKTPGLNKRLGLA
ncbi:amino acid ABC transporter substrate-binding protein, partial [Achromobacter sp.]|uniref:amino acid ABC transporter substrate-binding protein n=1 Tax=Achromobacter sp. TaxID=134375 RepID=UPI0025883A05